MTPAAPAERRCSRRAVLALGAGAALAACQSLPNPLAAPTPTPSPPPPPAPTSRPAVLATAAAVADLSPAARLALDRAVTSLRAAARTVPPAVVPVVEHDIRPSDDLAWAAARAAFSRVHPYVTFEHQRVPWEAARATLLAAHERGDLPAVGRLHNPDELAAAGLLIPLEELLSADEQRRIDPLVGPYRWDALHASGPDRRRRLYGLPYASATQAVLYNKAIFDQENIKPVEVERWTWSDFDRVCQQLARPDRPAVALAGANSLTSARLLHLTVRAFGGGLVAGRYVDSQTPVKVTINTPETIAGLNAFASLFRKGYTQPSAPTDREPQRLALFMAGQAALLPCATWEVATVSATLARQGIAVGSLPLPSGPAGAHTTVETAVGGLFVGARAANRLLPAFELLTFLSSAAGSRLFTLVSGALPGLEVLHAEEPWASDPLYSGFMFGLLLADRAAPRWMLTAADTVQATTLVGLIPGLLTGRARPEEVARNWEASLLEALDRLGVRPPR